jgi:hypothetical protein
MNTVALVVGQAPSVPVFGPVDTLLGPYIEYVLLVLVLVNLGARAAEYSRHVRQAEEDGAEAITRHPLRVATNFLLVVGAFYLATVEYHAGMVFSVLVVGMVIADLFELESRKVEARRDIDIERPKGAIAASLFTLAYISYTTLFFVVAPVWDAIV